MMERSNTDKSITKLDSVTTAVAFDGTNPETYAREVNPAAVTFLREHPELVRAGIVFADFIGKNDSLAWEIINVNPDIRKDASTGAGNYVYAGGGDTDKAQDPPPQGHSAAASKRSRRAQEAADGKPIAAGFSGVWRKGVRTRVCSLYSCIFVPNVLS